MKVAVKQEEDHKDGLNINRQKGQSVNEMDHILFMTLRHKKQNSTLKNIIQLKELFSLCLPRMSKQHILTTIRDENHINLIMVKDKKQFMGAVTFRLFSKNKFIQIVFFAIKEKYQRKGFGTKLMTTLKNELIKMGIKNILTYADDLAHMFFYRQGFSYKIAFPRSQFEGLIQKYEGGTLMHCFIEEKKVQLQKIDNNSKQQKATNNSKNEKIIEQKQQKIISNSKQQKPIKEKYQKPLQQQLEKIIEEKQVFCPKKVKKQSVIQIPNKKEKKKNNLKSSNQNWFEQNSLMKWIRKSELIKTEQQNNQ